jgi:hypothetical protein
VAIADEHLPILDRLVTEARAALQASSLEPLHCKILFHNGPRQKSAFAAASAADVERVCANLIWRVSALNIAFYFGRVERKQAPKILHVALTDPDKPTEAIYGRLKLELPHLQWFAYGAASTRACHVLPAPADRLIVDQNKSVVRWFNENRQAGRLQELFWMDAGFPKWPAVTFGDDAEHPGLQVADILTYFATKQFLDQRFAIAFDAIRDKTQFMVHQFDEQACRPYLPPEGITVRPFPSKK